MALLDMSFDEAGAPMENSLGVSDSSNGATNDSTAIEEIPTSPQGACLPHDSLSKCKIQQLSHKQRHVMKI